MKESKVLSIERPQKKLRRLSKHIRIGFKVHRSLFKTISRRSLINIQGRSRKLKNKLMQMKRVLNNLTEKSLNLPRYEQFHINLWLDGFNSKIVC
jgi:hypothetical protein